MTAEFSALTMEARKHENKLANQTKQKEPSQKPTWNYIKSLSNNTVCAEHL